MEQENKSKSIVEDTSGKDADKSSSDTRQASGDSTGHFSAAIIISALVVGWVMGGMSSGSLSFSGDAVTPAETIDVASSQATKDRAVAAVAVDTAVFPTGGIETEATWGDIVPGLVEKGVIDYDKFTGIFERSGTPLDDSQLAILTKSGASTPIRFDTANSRFTVNTLWAIGLAQQSIVLDEGKMKTGNTPAGRFASTGGWTLGKKSAMDYYSKWNFLGLDRAQQERVRDIAANIYRPCCGNSAAFPDCNHGMAMLGLVELMVSQGASDEAIYDAAQAANTYWFPQTMSEIATYFKEIEDVEWEDVDAKIAVGNDYMSGSGSRRVSAALQAKALIPAPITAGGGSGGGCGA